MTNAFATKLPLVLSFAGAMALSAAAPAFAQSYNNSSDQNYRHDSANSSYGQARSSKSAPKTAMKGMGPNGECWYTESAAGMGGQMGYWGDCGQPGGSPNR